MAKRNVDLTSKAWRDLVFEGKNQDFGAYKLRQKSENRHTLAVIFTLIGLVVVILGVIGWSKWSDYREQQRLLALQEERERMSQIEMAQDMEEVPEEEEEQEYKKEEEKIPEVVEEVLETVQQTQIAIVEPDKVINEVRTMDEVKEDKTTVGVATVEGTTDDADKAKAFKEQVVQVPEPPKEEPKPIEQPKPKVDEIFTAVEQPAQFPGGDAKMMQWLSKNIRYPDIAQQNGVQGRVIVKFVVEKDGKVSSPSIVKGVDKDLDREAMRVVQAMPKWQPGKNNGQPVRSYFTLPVTFKLQNQ